MAYGIVPWQIEKHYYKLLNAFKDEILDRYFSATYEYLEEYQKIKSSRTVEKLLDL
jgi:hypothetical protein